MVVNAEYIVYGAKIVVCCRLLLYLTIHKSCKTSGNIVPSTSGSVAMLDERASTTSAQQDAIVNASSGVNYKVIESRGGGGGGADYGCTT